MVPSQSDGDSASSKSPVSYTQSDELAARQLQGDASELQEQRSLPDHNVTSASVEDAYVQFIFYCNPTLSSSLPATELRRGFRSMPRADGKSFEIYSLYELIRKLEKGEIGTWNNLVLQLGVDPPDVSKQQSSQKLQQYAVRLKRWLHAYHIDAFFQYCIGKPHSYYTEIPSVSEALSASRDGVQPEEDGVLRALLPDTRPKRGRPRESGIADDAEPAKRVQRGASTAVGANADHQQSASFAEPPSDQSPPDSRPNPPPLPHGYSPEAFTFTPYMDPYEKHMNDVWAAASKAFIAGNPHTPAETRTPNPSNKAPVQVWRSAAGQNPKGGNLLVPNGPIPSKLGPPPHQTPYPNPAKIPKSAIDLHAPRDAFSIPDGSQSAHPSSFSSRQPSSNKARRKPASVVSAAWQSAGSKPRGRPPSNKTTQNGPYASFPSKDGNSSATPIDIDPPSALVTATTSTALTNRSPSAPGSTQPVGSVPLPRKPSKLSLQVPHYPSGPVRLATPPPPTVTVTDGNGLADTSQAQTHAHAHAHSAQQLERRSSADFFNSIDEEAADVGEDEIPEDRGYVDWKRRAMMLQRKLLETQAELKAVKRRVMEAIM